MKKIEAYDFGRIRIEGRSYSADLILYPDRIETDWRRKQGHLLQVEDLAGRIEGPCDLLLVGTGAHGAMAVSAEVDGWLQEQGIPWEALPTGQACDRYNALVEQGKRVIVALHLTC